MLAEELVALEGFCSMDLVSQNKKQHLRRSDVS